MTIVEDICARARLGAGVVPERERFHPVAPRSWPRCRATSAGAKSVAQLVIMEYRNKF